ncbi:formate dehydrogenase accessory sulfurtransferase FdhD [Desulfocurvibacter africanus]|uniref:Formate dehydrogenase subunit FdhD n=1 Tax=Desulfocurvibacter africanus subsp. africanus str. Walvis Bay TaxID=690850 RepID=F3Z290_DESAF|nr:formate dehydrogenase accessory sulfurtransferase FdhD [Desulfocurvibacter africanus]EGJ50130.1 formate dehydrogenase subunit FdhD [Desulfocurvibacter africanus subsp. africanus str. Walvis Bay]
MTANPAENLVQVACRQFKDGAWRDFEDVVSREEIMAVAVAGQQPRFLWAYPHDLETLALGHVRLEVCGALQEPVLTTRQGNNFYLDLRMVQPDLSAQDQQRADPFPGQLSARDVLTAMEELFRIEGLWQDTGCFHRAALYDPVAREFPFMAQDIGRHNCLDRCAGWLLREGRDPASLALFVSARVTASLCLKIRKLGVPMVVSKSAVTTASLDMAAKSGLTLVGFAREGRFTVFADPKGRIGQ